MDYLESGSVIKVSLARPLTYSQSLVMGCPALVCCRGDEKAIT